MHQILCGLAALPLQKWPDTFVLDWDTVAVRVVHGEVYGHGHRGHLVEGRQVAYILLLQPLPLTV